MKEKIIYLLKKKIAQKKWKKRNKNNKTWMDNYFNIDKVSVGIYTYGPIHIEEYGNNEEYLKIGNFCSIGRDTKFLLGGEHKYTTISTYPFKKKLLNEYNESTTKGKIIIEDDVWIGNGAIILSGVTVHQGAIIGAGTIVTKDVPPYAIYAGNRIIKYRFSNKIIDKLLKFNWGNVNCEIIKNNIDWLYTEIDEENIDNILKKLEIC